MENSPSTIAALLLRNLVTSIFVNGDDSQIQLSQSYKFLQLLRCFLNSVFLFFLGLLQCFFPSLRTPFSMGGDSGGVSRALSQLLLIMNNIPVSSRKYELVRSLAEKLIHDNLLEDHHTLRKINCAILSAAFARSLSQLESAVAEQGRTDAAFVASDEYCCFASRLVSGVKHFGRAAWRYSKSSRSECSAEKMAAELLWLAQKMVASGCANEAVCKWASASNLAWLALSTAHSRLQGSLVKVSEFLIKQAKEMGDGVEEDEKGRTTAASELLHVRQTKMKMLISWLPLLCRANNGTDAPILNTAERAALERILEEIISTLDEEDEQEKVLSLWIHHFTYCSASDWPDLHTCYTRWLNASRRRLLLEMDTAADSV